MARLQTRQSRSLGCLLPGKTGISASIRESGNLPAGGRPFSARETPKGALMQPRRIGGRAYACRLSHIVLSLGTLAFLASPAHAFGADFAGTVVDQNGRPLPRAHVRVVAGSGSQTSEGGQPANVFADDAGR